METNSKGFYQKSLHWRPRSPMETSVHIPENYLFYFWHILAILDLSIHQMSLMLGNFANMYTKLTAFFKKEQRWQRVWEIGCCWGGIYWACHKISNIGKSTLWSCKGEGFGYPYYCMTSECSFRGGGGHIAKLLDHQESLWKTPIFWFSEIS